MKTILLAAGIAATATLFPTAPKQACAAQATTDVAISGCCKKKESSRWVPIGRDFEECVRLNASNDSGDDVFDRAGNYWWDTKC